MTEYRSDLLRVFEERGYIHQISDPAGLDEAAATGNVVTYVGYDCTADSLHIGHLVSIMMLRRLQEAGHKPIVLMGGGTSRVGDPSFRDQQRPLLGDAAIAANKAAIKRSFANFLRFGDAPSDAAMADNAEWLDELRYIPFLREVGRHFSVSRMLTMDSVKSRLDRDQPYSFLEFNYMLLQSYDFVELAKRYGCRMQMGGSDQWGNIVMGVELGRRMADLPLFALTTPLITTASGEKMGKTAAGAVWLNPDRLSGHDYWQFWRNTEDADVGRFLKLFTDLPLAEIARLGALGGVEINEAKKILANEATALCRGAATAERAAETARKVFEQGATGDDLPTLEVPRAALDAGLPLAAALADAGLAASRGEARRLIQQGGVRVNDVPAGDPQAALRASDLDADGRIKLSAGRKRHALLRAV